MRRSHTDTWSIDGSIVAQKTVKLWLGKTCTQQKTSSCFWRALLSTHPNSLDVAILFQHASRSPLFDICYQDSRDINLSGNWAGADLVMLTAGVPPDY